MVSEIVLSSLNSDYVREIWCILNSNDTKLKYFAVKNVQSLPGGQIPYQGVAVKTSTGLAKLLGNLTEYSNLDSHHMNNSVYCLANSVWQAKRNEI